MRASCWLGVVVGVVVIAIYLDSKKGVGYSW